VNFTAGAPPTPNKIDVKLSTNGRLDIYNFTGTAHLVLDVFGYYADHTHDDRYVRAEQVLNIPSMSLQTISAELWQEAGCMSRNPGEPFATGQGWVPLVLPVGARLVSVTVTMRDAAGPETYGVQLLRQSMVESDTFGDALSTGILAMDSGGSGDNVAVEHTLVPVQPIVGEGQWFVLSIDLGVHPSTNGFCGATVTIDHAG